MLREALERILREWPAAIQQSFTGHPLGSFIRNDFVQIISKIISNRFPDFQITGGAGAGNWANVPWVSILNPKITTTTQDGIYPVYLFCADGSGVYLSLNQGTTRPRQQLGKVNADRQATEIRNMILTEIPTAKSWGVEAISLNASTPLGKSYELPNIIARYYPLNSLPQESELIADLLWMMEVNNNISPIWIDLKARTGATTTMKSLPNVNIPKPFLLLAGISGTGKTRFVREQAKVSADFFGVMESENYCLVPVRPDWHEPSDLLGYISRIGSGGTRYVTTDLLRFIIAAWKHAAETASAAQITRKPLDTICPFWLCLDEMNLAPVEQYFADYLSILETRKWDGETYSCDPLLKPAVIQQQLEESGRKNLWENLGIADGDPLSVGLREYFSANGIPLPPNLIVAGTVNMDETTHGFSRKVIDRALTIDFGEFFPNDYDQYFEEDKKTAAKPLSFPRLSQINSGSDLAAVVADPDGRNTIAFLSAVNDVLSGTPFVLAFRALNEALLSVVCFNPADTAHLQAVWDDFLMMKVLPRIEGDAEKLNSQDDTSLLTRLSDLLKDQLSAIAADRLDLLNHSSADGTAVQTTCRSLKKLAWMQKRLADNGFTTFWP
ncbi:MAG TPA: DUF3578 domain-containing protein [Dongiaceae bacterium]|nr:DUF3578 domain-containing protein [Dongiaceae bacterium]